MKLELYKTVSPKNAINKRLEEEIEYDITFKGEADYLNPVVKLKTNEEITHNYAYIPDFERYYFVQDIIINPNNLVILHLEVDVLESFKEDILNSRANIQRYEGYNKYYDGGSFPTEVKKDHSIYYSDIEPEFKEHLILVTIGGN